MKLRISVSKFRVSVLNWLKKTSKFLMRTVFMLAFLSSVMVIVWHFGDIQQKTTHLTNYGFAILAALASICFSWNRAIEKNNDGYEGFEKKVVLGCGECSFSAAILFLVASLVKYISFTLLNYHDLFDKIVGGILNVVSAILFPLAFGFAALAISIISMILFVRLLYYMSEHIALKERSKNLGEEV